jgi:hypothetical protein
MKKYVGRIAGLLVCGWALLCMMGAIHAQEIRYFVVQSTGLFEVKNISTGGRFTVAPTNEYIHVGGRGVLQVRGYTDRAARSEIVATQVRGVGTASVSVTYTPPGGRAQSIFAGPLNLTAVVPQPVSANTSYDNITVNVAQSGRLVTRRLPVGSRP